MRLLYIAFLGAPFVFLVNIILAFFSTVGEYGLELELYPYVEGNAKAVALLSLAIAVFVVLRIGRKQIDEQKPRVKLFLWLIL
ncbi:hypothetical protein ACFLTP_08525 [Chloroflexota bacterium]